MNTGIFGIEMKVFSFLLKTSIFVLLFIALHQCFGIHTHMSHLTNNEIQWIGPYKEKQHYYNASNMQYTDTMYVLLRHVSNSYNPIYVRINVDGSKTYEAGGRLFYYLKDKQNRYTIIEYLFNKPTYTDTIRHMLDIQYELDKRRTIIITEQQQRIGRFEVDGMDFEECLIVDFNYPDSTQIIRDWYIDKLVWAKGTGLIYYRRINGNEFHIDPKRLYPQLTKPESC